MVSLPIIDPTPYLPNVDSTSETEEVLAERRKKTAEELHRACRDIGFFYLRVDQYLNKEEMREILDVGREFFQRPSEEKELVGLDKSDGVRGYQRLHQNITLGKADHHEGYDIYAPSPYPENPPHSSVGFDKKTNGINLFAHASNSLAGNGTLRPLEGSNPFPIQPERFRGTVEGWVEKMKVLGMAVMRGMADGLGMSEDEWLQLRSLVDDSFWVMRVIGYPPLPDDTDGISCGEHKDYGCLTFLHADPINGSLQVLPRYSCSSNPADPQAEAERWIHADPIDGCLVVNIGSMWEIWTGGLYPATLHRVVHRSPKYRISVPFFFEPNFTARISLVPAAERKAEAEGRKLDQPRSKQEVVYGDFLLQKVGGNFKY